MVWVVTKSKLFRDPVHGYIEVNDCALEIIDSPFFQRLRRIKQLSFTSLVYHGAEHTRFGHSLGVYHLANRVLRMLLSDEEDKNLQEEFCLAALLHDIGHHPFSHSFESVLNMYSNSEVKYSHEEYTEKIIEKTEIGQIIEDHGFSKSNVKLLLKGHYAEKYDLQYLNTLLSSELDIDRLDYLLRDSYYCGIPYGKIDLERLFYNIKSQEDKIVVTEKGLSSVEMYVLSRFYMYTQVYTHKTTRAFDLMLQKIFTKEILDEINYPKPTNNEISKMLDFDDYWLISKLKELTKKEDFPFNNLASGILNRKPIKCVIEKITLTSRDTQAQHPDYTRIDDLRAPSEYQRLANIAGISEDWIFFDIPWPELPFSYHPYYSPGGETEEKSEILVEMRSGEIKDIALLESSIAYYISRVQANVIRIYTLEKYREKLGQTLEKVCPKIGHLIWKDKWETLGLI